MKVKSTKMDPSLVRPQPHLSTYGVLKESIKTTTRNGRLAVSILLFVFLSSSQLELSSRIALRPLLESWSTYWPVQEKVTSFQNRARVLAEAPTSSPWAKRNIYYSYQRASSNNADQTKPVSNRTYSSQRAYQSSYNGYTGWNQQARSAHSYQRAYPSSYNGYTGRTKPASSAYPYQRAYPSSYNGYTGRTQQASSAYSYQRAYPSSYNGYTGRSQQASSAYSYQQAYPSSYNGYMGRTQQASSAYSYQRAYPSSYNGYTGRYHQASKPTGAYSYKRPYPSWDNPYPDHTNQASQHNRAYSYQRTNPSSYGYKGQTKRMGNQKGAYTYHHANPTSYGYMSETNGKGEIEDVRVIFGMYVLILTISSAILLFFMVATISSSYEAYTAKVITLKDVFLKFRESWKRSIHTGIFLTLISSGFFLILVFFIGLISLFTEGSSTYVLFSILIIPGYIGYIHLASLSMMSFVVSILESEYSGLKAIVRGGELMKGKSRQAYLLIVLFNLANAGVNTISSAYSRKLNKCANMSITMPFVIGMVCVIKFLMFVAFSVYYHERKINQEGEKVEGRVGVYVPIASDEV